MYNVEQVTVKKFKAQDGSLHDTYSDAVLASIRFRMKGWAPADIAPFIPDGPISTAQIRFNYGMTAAANWITANRTELRRILEGMS